MESWTSDESDSELASALDDYISSSDDEILSEALQSYEVTTAANEIIAAIRELNSWTPSSLNLRHSPPSHPRSATSTALEPQPSTSSNSNAQITGLLF